MINYFDKYDWETMLNQHGPVEYDISQYFEILCPRDDYPPFLDRYIQLPVMQRLAGVGLLCGTDWTPLYKNRFYYSRLDHSKGVALIVWHFTHDKAQTIAGLLHDISTPDFSHVSDFRKGDALTQTATEEPTARIIRGDAELGRLLAEDGLTAEQVEDYHIYPIADNEIPQLSADRLEYMFPSGMALDGSWTMEEIRLCYNDLTILKNEEGADELGFRTLEVAELYCEHFCMIGHILQLNENKLALHMLGQIMNMAVKAGVLSDDDFMRLSEREVMERLDNNYRLAKYYRTFRTMTSIEHTQEALPESEYFCVNLKVKQRYINPLVGDKRLSDISEKARHIIEDFKTFSDTPYGCVKLV
jgi:HD superfamily phosphohydrolase